MRGDPTESRHRRPRPRSTRPDVSRTHPRQAESVGPGAIVVPINTLPICLFYRGLCISPVGQGFVGVRVREAACVHGCVRAGTTRRSRQIVRRVIPPSIEVTQRMLDLRVLGQSWFREIHRPFVRPIGPSALPSRPEVAWTRERVNARVCECAYVPGLDAPTCRSFGGRSPLRPTRWSRPSPSFRLRRSWRPG